MRKTWRMALPALLLAWPAGLWAQQPRPVGAAGSCYTDDAISGGQRRPPTPGEVAAREQSGCSAPDTTATPSVDESPQAGKELDRLYDKLLQLDRSQPATPP